MQEDVSLNPRIGAVEIEHIVTATRKNVVVILDNRLAGTVAAGEIHDVVVPRGAAEKIVAHNAAPA